LPFSSDLPLHNQVGTAETTCGRIEESAQDGTGDTERRVGDDAIRIGRERRVASVGLEHGDVAGSCKAPGEHQDKLRIELDGKHLRRALGERTGERAATRPELDDAVVTGDAGVGNDLRRESAATEEVLAELSPTGASGSCLPGHGRPHP
jgi:hypothetical protein